MNTMRDCRGLGKMVIAAGVGALLLFIAAPRSQADDRAQCQQRVERAEARLNNAISKFGAKSEQANAKQRDLNTERERCWKQNHAWWGVRDHQWHTERDWDRYDQGRIVRGANGQPVVDVPRDPNQN